MHALLLALAVGRVLSSLESEAPVATAPASSQRVAKPPVGWPSAQPQPEVVTPLIVIDTTLVDPAVFASIPALVCPEGTQSVDRLPQTGGGEYDQWCSRPDGVRHGPIVTWHSNARRSTRGQYIDGRIEGTWIYWYPTGERHSVYTYRDDKPHGVLRSWHPNGKLEEQSHYVAGKRHGPTTRWYANGQVFVTTDYVDDAIVDGIHTFYYETGAVIDQGPYVDGARHGEWTVYHPDGHVLERQRFVRGEQTK